MSLEDILKAFHGPLFSAGSWNCKTSSCCALCKTKNTTGKKRHWAKNLCRSCYRRLSASHRLYNDKWNAENLKGDEFKKTSIKKAYKNISPDAVDFDVQDIQSLLDRYEFKCAYCKSSLQDFNHKEGNAFQVEYNVADGKTELVPICRKCNCSKKNICTPDKMKRWCEEKGISFPVHLIPPKKD